MNPFYYSSFEGSIDFNRSFQECTRFNSTPCQKRRRVQHVIREADPQPSDLISYLPYFENLSNTQKSLSVSKALTRHDIDIKDIEGIAPVTAKKTEAFDKVIVIEVFSDFFNCPTASKHITKEMVGNTESGWNLAKKYHPEKRFIWSLNDELTDKVTQYASYTSYKETVNLVDSSFPTENPLNLTPQSKVIIVAQGNLEEEKIANLEADAFIEMLNDDFEINQIAELELVVCKMGNCDAYLGRIQEFFQTKQSNTRIVSYTKMISVDMKGDIIGFDDITEDNKEENPLCYLKDIDKIQKNIFVKHETQKKLD